MATALTRIVASAHSAWLDRPITLHDDDGQATTEYALVLLGAALVALMLIAWATAGGGAGKIGRLFDRVMDAVLEKI
jgi:Flp pilus assembly pilin Flp